MSLFGGDLTTPQRAAIWMANAPTLPSSVLSQLITSMTALIYGKLNRSRTFSQTFTRTFDGVGNMQLVLPDYPVTNVVSLQQGGSLINPSVIVPPGTAQPTNTSRGYGYRLIPWNGNLPGENAVLEFVNGYFYTAAQNVIVTYQAGYLVQNESWTAPVISPFTITVNQPQGVWCRDNGVVYATTGVALTPVATITGAGQYIPPPDSNPGTYTFSSVDGGRTLLISYSFVPADLEEACIQMVAERYSYRSRIGEVSKSLGGQETVRFMRGNSSRPYGATMGLPPEVEDLIWPYVSVVPPNIGAPL